MASIQITLPENMNAFVDEQVSRRGYKSADEYLRELVRAAQAHEDRAAIETALREGPDSGPPVEMHDEYWAHKRSELLKRRGVAHK